MRIKLGSRRDVIAALIGAALAVIGWAGAAHAWQPWPWVLVTFVREPGWELAVFLRSTRLPFREAFAVAELTVAGFNWLVWTGAACGVASLWRAISAAWSRSALRWAILVALGSTAVAELATFDNYALFPGAFWVVSPGWSVASRVSPITSFVIDFRTPLGLFSYPDRLRTTTLAFGFNVVILSACLYLFATCLKWVRQHAARNAPV